MIHRSSRSERRFDAVLFDMDGVLVDSEPWWNGVRIEFARDHRRPWTTDDQAAVMGGNSREWARTMRERLRLDDLTVDEIQDAVVAGVVARYASLPAPVIGDSPAHVRRIAATWHTAIASSSHHDIIAAVVEALGLRGVLDALVSSDDVPQGKPAPDVYLAAASRLGVDPGRCLVIEDSINGVLAGKAAGMAVALVPNASVPPGAGARELADAIVADLAHLDPDDLPG